MATTEKHHLRVLYIIGQLQSGGAEHQLLQVVRHHDRDRFHVAVCALWPRGELVQHFRNNSGEWVSIHKHHRYDITTILRLAYYMRQQRIDIVHTLLNTAGIVGRLAALLARKKNVIASERSIELKPNIQLERFLARHTSLILANSERVKTYIQSVVHVPEDRVYVLPNGVDLSAFEAGLPFDEIRKRRALIGLDPLAPTVGILARLDPVKDHITYLQAAYHINQIIPTVQHVIIGDGPLRGILERQTAMLGLEKRVHFLGNRSDISWILPVVDVSVLSSKREGFSNAILEAMAVGRPVVATDVGGNAEAVVNGETGYLVAQGDPQALATAVLGLIRTPNLAQYMGTAGRLRVESYFEIKSVVRKLETIYEGLVSGCLPDIM